MANGLRWERDPDRSAGYATAWAGQLIVGSIGRRADGSCWYSVTLVRLGRPYRAQNLDVASLAAARRGVQRYWNSFLEFAELAPAPPDGIA